MSSMREFVLSLKSPVVFQGRISEWEMLTWTEEKWVSLFENKTLPFRCGLKKCTALPQWERTCTTQYLTLSDFFKNERECSSESWKYFDYKYVNQWLTNSDAFGTLSWANFGFPEITQDDCTLWIGSSGSHTPCHMDSYGCNLVAQVYGHKQWILFPPSEGPKLKMTRVPYEESSIYSGLNFNAPLSDICDTPENAFIVTLSPGDVLFVPHHWWHYVENLDTAIAINTWIPLSSDDHSRMNEVLVKFFVAQLISNLSPEQALNILNPNEDDLGDVSLITILSQMDLCVETCLKASKKLRSPEESTCNDAFVSQANDVKCGNFEETDVVTPKRKRAGSGDNADSSSCLPRIQGVTALLGCKPTELKSVLDAKCKCRSAKEHKEMLQSAPIPDAAMKLLPNVINAFSHPDVIEAVTKCLLAQVAFEKM